MENRGLIFIPDISGFTGFINKVDIEHGRLIIQELLELLVNANQIGLEISEIEGDAILFYKYGDAPGMEALYKQVEKMFCDFHQNLYAYDLSKYCQCNACTSAINLTLKVITHYGEFTGYQVKDFNKLIGKDIIVAHQLLKNEIDHHEYWLMTESLVNKSYPENFHQQFVWHECIKRTENGEIPYRYTQLTGLKNKIPKSTLPDMELPGLTRVYEVKRNYETDIITLFRTAGLFEFRDRWREGVKAVEDVSHYLPRVGMKCRCIFEKGARIVTSSNYTFHPDRIEFLETEEPTKNVTGYHLEKLDENKTRLTMSFYVKRNLLSKIISPFTKSHKDSAQRSLERLDSLVREVEFPY